MGWAEAPATARSAPLREPEARKADDGPRTRDLELGKLALYQLSYVRADGRFYAAPPLPGGAAI
jgi:hypothetical protein